VSQSSRAPTGSRHRQPSVSNELRRRVTTLGSTRLTSRTSTR
jgi:hypothetical protein